MSRRAAPECHGVAPGCHRAHNIILRGQRGKENRTVSRPMRQDFEGVHQVFKDLTALQGAMNDELDSVGTTAERFVQTWDGTAQDEYYKSQTKWNTAASELNFILGRIGASVASGNRNMIDLEDGLTRQWIPR
ncbi:hypothetical protein F8M49_03675 [Rhodococcus zopfii]|uniref:WXG100 family type VII secretion target n=1 Tax=Rhodococcus zopfii TaxID=43772 RepID=A0ABU3WLC2_9NOCA|nr:hypothetical protein [Rhodococcus zopfii]